MELMYSVLKNINSLKLMSCFFIFILYIYFINYFIARKLYKQKIILLKVWINFLITLFYLPYLNLKPYLIRKRFT